jgi:predicted nucleic acid-binding protein
VNTFLDASVIVCHLTGDPAELRAAATDAFTGDHHHFVSDVAIADAINLLETVYDVGRHMIATAMRSVLVSANISSVDTPVLLRALGIYEIDNVRFPTAHAVALAESTGIDGVSSLDSSIDRIRTVTRVGP